MIKKENNGKQKGEMKLDWKSGLKKFAKEKLGQEMEIPDERMVTKSIEKLGLTHANNITNHANAPYNFVPLNDKVVPSEKMPYFDRYHDDRYTGYIKLTIETKTPLYIRDTLTKEELERGKEAKDISDFFSPAGKIQIPGSSLRGMIRTMVEIVSHGKFGFFNDKRLYFRAVADRSKLGSDYKALMVDEGDNYFPRIKAGILKKVGRSYAIYPSKTLPATNGTQIYRINFNKTTKVINGTTGFVVPPFEFREIYFNPVPPVNHTHTMPNGKKHKLKYALLSSVSETKNSSHPQLGFIIASGEFGNKKHMHWVINEPENNYIEIDERIIKEYRDDSSRDERADLLIKVEGCPNGVPCFYLTDDTGKIISFGHTGMFRLSYTKTIGEHILSELKGESNIDIAEALFGNEKTFAGRVFFEDAYLLNPTNNDFEDEKIPKTLLGPKPTAFQHYLIQTNENLQDHPKNLAHYNMNTAIRGNKLYWHKSPDWVKEKQNDFNPQIDTKIKPVKANKTFSGCIRFENLSKVELGALLFALALPDGCCHKLGMGKPLGLGSVKITPTLYLSNRKSRYTDLLAEWKTEIQPSEKVGEKIDDFKKAFQSYVLDKLCERSITDLWDVDRMKELKRMLAFNIGASPTGRPSDDKTKYMELGEFRQRRVLPKPTKVKL